MLITPSFKKSLMVEQFQGNYLKDFVCDGFCKFAVYKGVIYGVWLTRIDAVAVCIYPISEEFFLCNDNPMNKFELKFLQLIFSAYRTPPSYKPTQFLPEGLARRDTQTNKFRRW